MPVFTFCSILELAFAKTGIFFFIYNLLFKLEKFIDLKKEIALAGHFVFPTIGEKIGVNRVSLLVGSDVIN